MKRFINTIKNIWGIKDLRDRILYTLGLILVYRIGSYVIIPGINPSDLGALQSQTQDGVLGLLNMFSGGAFSNASIFALGIMPYITASIVIQLLTMVVPYFMKMQREGESGRNKINQITRWLTVIVTIFQSFAYLANLRNQLQGAHVFNIFGGNDITFMNWVLPISILLTCGTMFVMWLGERITDKGIGNGISLLIMIGIIARLPFALFAEFASRMEDQGGQLVMLFVELIIWLVVIMLCILLVQGTRRIPVQYAKRIVGNKQYGGARQYIPIKVNAAGVMPIIFAQAIMFIPVTIMGFSGNASGKFAQALTNFDGIWYNLIFGFMVIIFTYFYTAVAVNPKQMADDMKRNGGFVPGVKPGKKTEEFFDNILSKVTLPGSIFLAAIAILPAIIRLFGVNSQFAQFYGGTSLLILVGVVLDTLQQIESHLLMRHYDGLTKTGRIKGRGGNY
ncbi:MAG: preprotein translocase subunit SecY [Bacteroidales bacterium]|nr:preprotein translocase subunit SecY [Candidatus Scybalousia scybalohippi]MCQ2326058.1 preprotein translocase subunit SecY [Bacteroidales bacterium]